MSQIVVVGKTSVVNTPTEITLDDVLPISSILSAELLAELPVEKVVTWSYGEVKGSENTDHENADQAALPTNGALVGAETAVAAGAYTFPATAEPDVGRNVCICFRNDSGGNLDLYEGVMTFTATGTFRGVAQTEEITYTSTALNKEIVNTKYRDKYGVKPFDTVTAVTVDNICDDGIKIAVGIGSKIGFPEPLLTPVVADVRKVTKNGANVATAGKVDTTNETMDIDTLADDDSFGFIYKSSVARATRHALTVVSITPAADYEVELTAADKIKLYLATALTANDRVLLNVRNVGEITRP